MNTAAENIAEFLYWLGPGFMFHTQTLLGLALSVVAFGCLLTTVGVAWHKGRV